MPIQDLSLKEVFGGGSLCTRIEALKATTPSQRQPKEAEAPQRSLPERDQLGFGFFVKSCLA
jgi:hypothetical protein